MLGPKAVEVKPAKCESLKEGAVAVKTEGFSEGKALNGYRLRAQGGGPSGTPKRYR